MCVQISSPPDHPMPATDGTGGQQKQNGRQGRSLGTVLSLNLVWTAMQLAVPAPLRTRHQAKVLDQGLRFSHGIPARCLMLFSCCLSRPIHRTAQSMPTSKSGWFLPCRGCLASTLLSRRKAVLRGWQPLHRTELCREDHRWLIALDGCFCCFRHGDCQCRTDRLLR